MKRSLEPIVFLVVVMGVFVGLYFLATEHLYVNSEQIILSILFLILFLVMWYILFTVLHEIGHLLWGKIRGLTLVSFRIFIFEIYRYKNHFRFGISNPNGKMGDTKFYDKREFNPKRTYSFLIAGGILVALLTTPIFVFYCLSKKYNYQLNSFLLTGIIVGVLDALLSLFPFTNGKTNNGGQFAIMIKNPETKKAYYLTMALEKDISDQIPLEQINCDYIPSDVKSEIQVDLCLCSYYIFLAKAKTDSSYIEKAKERINYLYNETKPSRYLQGVIEAEMIFYLLRYEENKELAKTIYYNNMNKDIKKLIRDSYQPIFPRIDYIIQKDIIEFIPEKFEEEIIMVTRNCHYDNLANFCLETVSLENFEMNK